MFKLNIIFIICLILIVLTCYLVLNDFPFYIWMPVYIPVIIGQIWLMNGGKFNK